HGTCPVDDRLRLLERSMFASSSFVTASVTMSFDGPPVLDGLTLRVPPASRIALVGENGSGKTTLLRLLAGSLEPDRGTVSRPVRPALQSQVPTWADGTTVQGVLLAARAHADALVAHVTAAGQALADHPDDPAAADHLDAAIAAADAAEAWTAADRVAALTRDLGVDGLDPDRPLSRLSGGQRARLHLVEVLAPDPDGLLLDEPTNHLDEATAAALTQRLQQFAGPVVFASHDRQLIDDIATGVLDLDPLQGQPTVIPGGWTAYRRHHALARQQWERDFGDHRAAVDAVRATVRLIRQPKAVRPPRDGDKNIRYGKGQRADATASAKLRRARRDLEVLESDRVSKPPRTFHLRADTLTGTSPTGVLLSAVDVVITGRLAATRLDIPAGGRVLITGPNGSGKSTLLGVLDGSLDPSSGRVLRQPGVRIARLGQDVPLADPDATPLRWFADHAGSDAPQLVGLGLIQPRDLNRRVVELSIGQRRRLALAAVIARAPGVLLLDEPTDHLSLTLVEELEQALDVSPGAVVIASHDRWLRRRWGGDLVALGRTRRAPSQI
ncbi:MAG TPA: ATP-binding cassette domain-containing protein, partial [Euzebya sp.]|nr:ATP-binding cassette domain-containing protein [Euzebya sp.]